MEKAVHDRAPAPTSWSWRRRWPTSDPPPSRRARSRRPTACPSVELERTPDILAGLGADKPPGLLLVGFAAETADVAAYAAAKLAAERVDLMVANDVSAPGTGFAHDTNAVLLLGADGWSDEVSLRSKREVARAVLDAVVARRDP